MNLDNFCNNKWAKTVKGEDIPLYFSEDYKFGEKNDPILVVGGVHGDEPEGVELAESLLRWLRKNEEEGIKVNSPWLLVTCLNIDGRKAKTRVNGNGVDINRNYPTASWNPNFKEPRKNPGTHPLSEPESAALAKLIESEKPRLVIHCHSWHPCIISTGNADDVAQKLMDSSGYKLFIEEKNSTPGCLGDYCWYNLSIPNICIEEKDGMKLSKVWSHFAKGFEEIFLKEER